MAVSRVAGCYEHLGPRVQGQYLLQGAVAAHAAATLISASCDVIKVFSLPTAGLESAPIMRRE